MRMITSFEKENLAQRFSFFLQSKKIENKVEVNLDQKTGKFSYEVWAFEEDKINQARSYLEEFLKNPKDSRFSVSIKELLPAGEKEEDPLKGKEDDENKKDKNLTYYSFKLTSFTLILCVFIYLLNLYQEISIKKENPKISYVLLTPVQRLLLFDMPYVLIHVDEVINKYQIDPTKDISKQSPEAQKELEKIDHLPFWRGIYEIILLKKTDSNFTFASAKGTLFEKIRQGQVWRLISPCFLHKDLLHLLFNMLWLWMLGKQIEQRLSKTKYLLLILIIGIISNTAQYLMSGPYFLGYSGIITGMVGFIWSRQHVAPWEGYPLQSMVFLFLGVYVILMFILSFFSFVTQIVGLNLFTPNIANTAHIVGAIVGYVLGKIPFFSWRIPHER